jgi:hypothetical protein
MDLGKPINPYTELAVELRGQREMTSHWTSPTGRMLQGLTQSLTSIRGILDWNLHGLW